MVESCPPYGGWSNPLKKLSSTVSWHLGTKTISLHHMQYTDLCMRDGKAVNIDTVSWEGLAADRRAYRVDKYPEPTHRDRGRETVDCNSIQSDNQKEAR